jgi:3-hydroxyacyl-CoA dehydrogenase
MKKDVQTVVVIGAGTMGRGIAHVSAMSGFTTVIHDIFEPVLESALVQIRRELEKGVEIGKVKADLVGLDTRLNILNFLHQTLGEKYRPCPLLVKYVKAGRLGKKTGRGVYEYPQE